MRERLCRLYPDEVEEAVAVLSTLVGRFVWAEEAHVFSPEDLRREWLWRCLECEEGTFAPRTRPADAGLAITRPVRSLGMAT